MIKRERRSVACLEDGGQAGAEAEAGASERAQKGQARNAEKPKKEGRARKERSGGWAGRTAGPAHSRTRFWAAEDGSAAQWQRVAARKSSKSATLNEV